MILMILNTEMWYQNADSYRKSEKQEKRKKEIIEAEQLPSEPSLQDDHAFLAGDVDRLFAGLMVCSSHLQYLEVLPPRPHLL